MIRGIVISDTDFAKHRSLTLRCENVTGARPGILTQAKFSDAC